MTWRKRRKVEEGRKPVKKEEGQRGLSGTTQSKGSKRGKYLKQERMQERKKTGKRKQRRRGKEGIGKKFKRGKGKFEDLMVER